MLQWDRGKHLETFGITGLLNSLARDGALLKGVSIKYVCMYVCMACVDTLLRTPRNNTQVCATFHPRVGHSFI